MRDLAAALLLALLAVGEDWARITAPLRLRFPRDHGAHFDARTEWWYVTGELAAEGGRAFGYQLTIFRRGLRPGAPPEGASALRASHAFAAHLAVADLGRGTFRHASRLRRMGGGLAGASDRDLHVFLENWEIAREPGGTLRLRAADGESGLSLDLSLDPKKEPVLHGEGGVSRKGAQVGNASAYVSWTRLATSGSLGVGGETLSVRGESWFDHEWGTSQLGAGVVGWDWLGLRLDDGRELMLYGLRRADGTQADLSAGTLVGADGAASRLAGGDFTMEPLARWTSPRTKASYPAAWRIRVPSAGLDFEVAPRIADAELDTRATTGVVYWEGPVEAKGTATGRGYMELTGYAESMAGKL